jgi:hemerythrin superfamily protein
MDAITLLKDDHKTVEQLFKRFEKAGDRAHVEKRAIVDRIIEELSIHAAVEEQLFYPVVRATVPETEDVALESLEEHHIVKWVLSELEDMSPEDERFDAKVTVLMENVRHHVEEEETEFFPMVRDELGRNALSDLGDAMEAAKAIAPTRPHPTAPDTPPGNLVAGTAAGVADRIADTVSGIAQGGLTAVGDVIAVVLRRKRPKVSPTGSTTTRRTARKVRTQLAEMTETAIEATQKAKDEATDVVARAKKTGGTTTEAAKQGAKRTARTATRGATKSARAAKSGAKGAATSARTSAARTKTTAKRGATTTGRTVKKAAGDTGKAARSAARSTASTAKRSAAATR